MPGGIHHFAIQVRDLRGAERFYRDVLGFTVMRRWPYPTPSSPSSANPDGSTAAPSRERSVWLDLGDEAHGFLALEHVDGPPAAAGGEVGGGTSRPGHHLLAFRIDVSERREWEARLGAAGVVVTHRTAYTLYFADPEGNRLGLSHYPSPQSADET